MGTEEGGPGDPTQAPETSSRAIPHPIYNWLSIIGSVLATASLTVLIFLVVVGFTSGEASGYLGVLLLIPAAALIIGLLLTLAGLVRERARHRRGEHSSLFERKVFDPWAFLKKTGYFAVLAAVGAGTFVLMGVGAGSMAVVEYSESNQFCTGMCHQVMGPEASTYEHSPHARIQCVECHVGPGGDSYLRAKLGGIRQVWALATDTFSRPIPTPIHGRRPADEMCASCHTKERFVGYKTITRTYFTSGEEPYRSDLALLVKVGGGGNGLIKGAGIHYHMQSAQKVEYIARDPQRQDIPWVRVTRKDGEVKEYTNSDYPPSEEERAQLEVRTMECLDCHSRPAHVFRPPVDLVNEALATGSLRADLPYVKEAAVHALTRPYPTTGDAEKGIGEALTSFYEDTDEDALEEHADEIEAAVPILRDLYRSSIFPEMRASWKSHPNNAGHRDSPGCFRCHNDVMVDEDEEPLFYDCTTCHAVLAQDESTIEAASDLETGRAFNHPEDDSSFEEFTLCSDCHTGGAELYE